VNKYFAELIGTFFLVLTIGCTVIGHGVGPPAESKLIRRRVFTT
jgi:glycerol uptake facilitator-like aquaporin